MRTGFFGIFAALLLSGSANAAVVLVTETGTVSSVSNGSNQGLAGVQAGDAFTASFLYDTNAPVSSTANNPNNFSEVGYAAIISATFSVDGINVTLNPPSAQAAKTFTVINSVNSGWYDQYSVWVYNSANAYLNFVSSGSYSTIGSTVLPSVSDFAKFSTNTLQYSDGGGSTLNGAVQSVSVSGVSGVPEPQSWAMMIAGFGIIGGILRRKRSAPIAFS